MLIAIVQHTPLRVWGILAGLIALGLSQARPRAVGRARLAVLPIAMAAFSASGVLMAFGHLPVALASWVAGAGVALSFGRRAVAVQGAFWSADRNSVQLPGSWLPLAFIVGLFLVKYGAGVGMALHPGLGTEPVFAAGCSFVYGAVAGVFIARALSLRGFLTRTPRLRTV